MTFHRRQCSVAEVVRLWSATLDPAPPKSHDFGYEGLAAVRAAAFLAWAPLLLLLIFCGCFSPTSNPTSALPSDPIPVVERETKPAAKPADETPDRQPADKKLVPLTFEDLDISMEPDTLFEDWML